MFQYFTKFFIIFIISPFFKWVSICYWMPNDIFFFFLAISWWEQSDILMKWWWSLICTSSTSLVKTFTVLDHWNNSLRVDMLLHSRHIILINSQPISALTPSCCALSREAGNINFIIFYLTRLGLESSIYRPQGEHANHYTTAAFLFPDENIY